jgi:hypothetical protein
VLLQQSDDMIAFHLRNPAWSARVHIGEDKLWLKIGNSPCSDGLVRPVAVSDPSLFQESGFQYHIDRIALGNS